MASMIVIINSLSELESKKAEVSKLLGKNAVDVVYLLNGESHSPVIDNLFVKKMIKHAMYQSDGLKFIHEAEFVNDDVTITIHSKSNTGSAFLNQFHEAHLNGEVVSLNE